MSTTFTGPKPYADLLEELVTTREQLTRLRELVAAYFTGAEDYIISPVDWSNSPDAANKRIAFINATAALRAAVQEQEKP